MSNHWEINKKEKEKKEGMPIFLIYHEQVDILFLVFDKSYRIGHLNSQGTTRLCDRGKISKHRYLSP